jgi:predicted flap endonuclease-1-like 5' DNA nuclease
MSRVLPLLAILLCGGVAVLALLAVLLWWLLRRPPEEVTLSQTEPEAPPAPPDQEARAPSPPTKPKPIPAPTEPDDLKVIEGIGPKISSIFEAAGLTTFADLAAREPGELKTILDEAGIRLGDPTTWPEQAALAAQGRWEDLETLQGSLRGGRRT